jgi:hypothetical protein
VAAAFERRRCRPRLIGSRIVVCCPRSTDTCPEWPPPPGRMLLRCLSILPSFVVVLLSWPVSGPNRSLRCRRTYGLLIVSAELADPSRRRRARELDAVDQREKEQRAQLNRDKSRLEIEAQIRKR